MDKLLTKKDLAEHWKVTTHSIDNWVKEGLITPCKKVPEDMRFAPKYIAELDGVQIEKFSPLERHRLERELEEWKIRALNAEGIIAKITSIGTSAIGLYLKRNT